MKDVFLADRLRLVQTVDEDVRQLCLSAADRIEEQKLEIIELHDVLYRQSKELQNFIKDK